MKTKKKLKLRPLGDRVLVQRIDQEETLKGGIILPDSAKKKQDSARVIAVGKGKKSDDGKDPFIPVEVGDVILMDKYGGQEVTVDDEECVVLRFDEIIGIILEEGV